VRVVVCVSVKTTNDVMTMTKKGGKRKERGKKGKIKEEKICSWRKFGW